MDRVSNDVTLKNGCRIYTVGNSLPCAEQLMKATAISLYSLSLSLYCLQLLNSADNKRFTLVDNPSVLRRALNQ